MTAHYEWLTTEPNPRVKVYGPDYGQRGWKTHAVAVTNPKQLSFTDIRRTRAMCGLLPSHGWGMDLFIEDQCKRCIDAIERKATR